MSPQDEFNEFSRGYWADPDPKLCLCRGSGYALSDLDTWHKCPYHCTPTTRHPEDDYDDEERREELYGGDSAQCLEGDNTNPNEEKPKMPDDITDEELAELEIKYAPPAPSPPLTDDEIPF